jgi:hypothetical protein
MSDLHNLIKRIVVYCDEESDRQLFFKFQQVSALLRLIPNEHIRVLPKGKRVAGSEHESVSAFAEKDRSDFIFLYNDSPILVTECTEHGYTGDNPKQRFVRFRETARAKVPFIYFTTFSRVRDDELDDAAGRTPSKRRVNTDVWKGMVALTSSHGVPIVPVEWPLAANNKARKLGANPTVETIREIYGELLSLIEEILSTQALILAGKGSFSESSLIQGYVEKTIKLCETPNTRGSDVTVWMDKAQLRELLDDPQQILKYVGREEYFHKGKGFKLVALTAIDLSNIEWVMLPDERVIETSRPSVELSEILKSSVFDSSLVYYTGYEWRSDPHCGVAALLELLNCLAEDAISHSKALVLHWPRVYYSARSAAYNRASAAISTSFDSASHLRRVFVERYGSERADDEIRKVMLNKRGDLKSVSDLIGVWSDGTKQARVFRDICDLIVLSDAILLGDRWRQ